ncbi:MAG: NTP transferase domain-containing protein [Actinobacteria bacterium]|nr:NTP transferase domain-containing protein [Actinomycetota bacterium]
MSSTKAVILAAGKSTRMLTQTPKVLHEVCGRPMLAYVLDACRQAGVDELIVVVGYRRDEVLAAFADEPGITWVTQTEDRHGTGHALMCCREALEGFQGNLLVLCGDGPLIRSEVIAQLLNKHTQERAAVTLATGALDNPSGFGRIVRDEYGNFQAIVEHNDCSAEQLHIKEINPSYYCFNTLRLFESLEQVRPDNKKQEYYLTDTLGLLLRAGHKVVAITAVKAGDVLSINSRHDLATVGNVMKHRILNRLMDSGVTVVDPDNTYIDARATIGRDTVIHPFTYISGRVTIGRNCSIGPFAYLRDGTELQDDVVLGVFTEVKKSVLCSGTRVRHLSYIGDAQVGRQVNIGAGTITANFDGSKVSRTVIDDNTYVASGSILVAPLHVSANSQIAPGSVLNPNNNKSSARPDGTPTQSPTKQGGT